MPIGWRWTHDAAQPQSLPVWWSGGPHARTFALVAKLVGLLLTALALMLGAPFWFDALSKIARLRATGAPPPASDAVRHGEGEETRRGPTRG
jgi:hypothetical protein